MNILRIGLAVAAILLGGVAVFVGGIVLLSALREGQIQLSYGEGSEAVAETVLRDGENARRFWLLAAGLGGLPALLGFVAVIWGWRAISSAKT